MVPIIKIIGMLFCISISFVFPIWFMIYLRKIKGADLQPFFIGIFAYIIFALGIETYVFRIAFAVFPAFEKLFNENYFFYAAISGIMAALFEEIGRFVALKIVIKDKDKISNTLMYGLGHAGIEAIMLVSLTMMYTLMLSLMVNFGMGETSLLPKYGEENYKALMDSLVLNNSEVYFVAGIERIATFAIQFVTAYMTYLAVNAAKNRWMIFGAVGIQAVAVAVILIIGEVFKEKVLAAGLFILLIAALIGGLAILLYKKHKNDRFDVEEMM